MNSSRSAVPAGGEFDHHDFDLGSTSLMVSFLVIFGDVCYFFGGCDQNGRISGMSDCQCIPSPRVGPPPPISRNCRSATRPSIGASDNNL